LFKLSLCELRKLLSKTVATVNGEVREKGEVIFRQGEPGDSMYVLQSGAAEVLRDGPDGPTVAALLEQLKTESSKWMKRKGCRSFYWQTGYGAFSIGESGVAGVRK
jgi:hypothetical protein